MIFVFQMKANLTHDEPAFSVQVSQTSVLLGNYIEVVFRSERTGIYLNKLNLNILPNTIIVVKVDHGEDIGRVVNTSMSPEDVENIGKIDN